MISAVGRDDLGTKALDQIDKLGMNRFFVRDKPHGTGKCIVTLDGNGVPSFRVLQDTAYDNIEITDKDTELIRAEGFDAFYFGTLQQRGKKSRYSLLKILRECTFREIFCDINLRLDCYDEESIANILSYATVLKISDEEKPLLDAFASFRELFAGEDFAQKLFSEFPQLHTVLYTKGAEGSVIFVRNGESLRIPCVRVKAVSTVGAGDSYGAAYLASVMSGKKTADAGQIAASVSARVVSVTEAVPDYSLTDFSLPL